MHQPPTYTTWKITCQSCDEANELQIWLCNRINLDRTFTDKVCVTPDGHEEVNTVHHRLRDYFTDICIIPNNDGKPEVFRLLFERRPEAGRSWKDLMVNILREIESAPQTADSRYRFKMER